MNIAVSSFYIYLNKIHERHGYYVMCLTNQHGKGRTRITTRVYEYTCYEINKQVLRQFEHLSVNTHSMLQFTYCMFTGIPTCMQ